MFYSSRPPINRRALSLKRIGETSSQRHNLRLPGAVNQRARLRPPSYRDSDRPESSRCLARALACNESAKQLFRHKRRRELVELSGRITGRLGYTWPTTAYAIGGTATLALRYSIVSQTHCRPRPELDIDLTPAYLSPGNSEAGAGPVG